jgi:cation diffusion facilitator CzcD-associated flavoprotein CzcO
MVVQASQDTTTNRWKVSVRRVDGTDRIFNVKHVVFATGIGGIEPNMPKFPGVVRAIIDHAFLSRSRISQEKFKGQVLHSTEFKHAKDHAGKKVVVIGACTSGIVGQDSMTYRVQIY